MKLLKKVNAQRNHLVHRFILDNSTDMIFKLDLNFRRTYVSPASRDILGFDPEELTNRFREPSQAGRLDRLRGVLTAELKRTAAPAAMMPSEGKP